MESIKKNYVKQVLMLIMIISLGIYLFDNLSYFVPGAMGAVTLYILFRNWNFKLVEQKGWKKWIAAMVLILGLLIALGLPIYGLIELLTPKVNEFLKNTGAIQDSVMKTIDYVNKEVPQLQISKEKIMQYLQRGLSYIPKILSSTASVLANIFTALFLLYFMFYSGREMEKSFIRNLPLKRNSKIILWKETKNMIVSNALGIPFLALCQGIVAAIGFYIFGVPNPILWGLITGIATVIPVVGTMIVWVPICVFLLAGGESKNAIGLAIYCFVAVGGVDNVLRFVFVKKFGDVHPLITVFGVIFGLNVFGVMGLIFGPLLLSYFILMIKIYKVEFFNEDITDEILEKDKDEHIEETHKTIKKPNVFIKYIKNLFRKEGDKLDV